ncbi:glycosyltransferase [Polynucleobacter sp. UB-Piko-W3]|uniref:MraY family glycosyltransferase n=1 Tax=Polynucleobacter sp. UB-Piko-W3 TaxID=1819735 RepID=UPI001C0D3862|nr:glycosyltransferase [Polynucleobacter sp. UB-Piko-W3]MBU3553988.1 glycosyltransferase family 4 protein [Polynucleobacter sp. UB-Piko-W3]
MTILIISFLSSLLISLLILRSKHLHARFTADSDLSGVQKFHAIPVPRIGGLAVFLGVSISLYYFYFQKTAFGSYGLVLLGCSLPAFIFGLIEDLTKSVGIRLRLTATVVSALLTGFFLNAWLSSLQIFGVDNLMLAYPVLAIIMTCIAVAGVANAFNIIDGYNGLSSMVAVIILSGITFVAFKVGDYPIMISALAMIGALLGFFIWNYPYGRIFLGDGGAYLIGFWIAELSVLLTARHPEVSKWFPLLLCAYPIFETLFSIYRRLILKGKHPGMPDATHLHQLIYRRLVRWFIESKHPSLKIQRNSLTSPYLWLLSLLAVIPAILFWRNHILLKLCFFLFAITYIWFYRSIVLFRVSDLLILRNHPSDNLNQND